MSTAAPPLPSPGGRVEAAAWMMGGEAGVWVGEPL